MNLAIVIGSLGLALLLLWSFQSLLLWVMGEPLAAPFRYETRSLCIRYPMKVMVHVVLLGVIIGYAFATGTNLLQFLGAALEGPIPLLHMVVLSGLTILCVLLVDVLGAAVGALRFGDRFAPGQRIFKIVSRCSGAVVVASVEELVFRAVVLNALLWTLPQTVVATICCVVLSAGLFASVHFIKRRNPREGLVQPAIGLFFVGVLLGCAYVVSGQRLWVPISMHAAGIVGVEVSRLFIVYYDRRYRLLIGGHATPHAGIPGVLLTLSLTVLVLLWPGLY